MAYNNAVLVEKSIFSGIASDAAGDSEVIILKGASKLSCQAYWTVDTPSGATITFKGSNDQINWTNLESATAITVAGNVLFQDADVSYLYFKAVKAISTGDATVQAVIAVIGDA